MHTSDAIPGVILSIIIGKRWRQVGGPHLAVAIRVGAKLAGRRLIGQYRSDNGQYDNHKRKRAEQLEK